MIQSGIISALIFLGALGTLHAQTVMYAAVYGNQKYFVGSSTRNSGLFVSYDTAATWRHLGSDNLKTYAVDAVDTAGGRILYIGAGNGVQRSVDSGQTWRAVSPWRMTEVLDVKVDQRKPAFVYAATAFGFWRTSDGGDTWEQPAGPLKDTYVYKVCFYMDTILIALGERAVWESADRGNTWKLSLSMTMPRAFLEVPLVLTLLAGTQQIIWGCRMCGQPRLRMTAYGLACTRDTMIYAVGDSGVLRCTLRDLRWTNITEDLPVRAVHSVAAIGNDVFVGTFGDGIFRRQDTGWVRCGLDGSQVWSLVVKRYRHRNRMR